MKVEGTCKLWCKNEIICRSHIVPELCFRDLYNDKHIAGFFTTQQVNIKPIQKGFRERLLCTRCEAHINDKYEKPFHEYWKKHKPSGRMDISQDYHLHGINYAQFKLFHLSILWRMSVSKLQEYSSVELGPYENILRDMLLTSDPGPENAFPIIGRILLFKKDVSMPILLGQPNQGRLQKSKIYWALYLGCEWLTIIQQSHNSELLRLAPKKDGTMILSVARFTESFSAASIVNGLKAAHPGITSFDEFKKLFSFPNRRK